MKAIAFARANLPFVAEAKIESRSVFVATFTLTTRAARQASRVTQLGVACKMSLANAARQQMQRNGTQRHFRRH